MIKLMSKRLNFDQDAQALPDALIEAATEASRKITAPDLAQQAFDKLAPALDQFQPDPAFCVACGLLIEKQRRAEGMLAFWTDMARVFPADPTALRMMMRWYRRERQVAAGVEQLHQLFPDSHTDLTQAERCVLGLAELHAWAEIDQLMAAILPLCPDARAIRMRYIKLLNQQSRYLDARDVAESVQDADKMGPSSRALLDTAMRRAAKMSRLFSNDAADVFTQIIDRLEVPAQTPAGAIGSVTFYTGQLGTGGAERQMARIASAFQARFQQGETAGECALTAPVDVIVRHTTPASGADFYVPALRRARVETKSLADMRNIPLSNLRGIPPEILNLLELMPEDVCDATRKLVPHFQSRQTQVAYLWQDGGVLFAGLAALLAGVPRIVTSFRGLPPNLRPDLFRPEIPVLYHAMARLPHVTFTANSQVAATAYEDWLNLSEGDVRVLPNAVLPVQPEGEQTDIDDWAEILAKTRDCTRTVLGIFRFDDNKRPLLWIDVAAAHLKAHPKTRFVMVGAGYLQTACRARIAELGLADRIFLLGIRSHVGFFIHKADLVMHLARMEGLPNVLIEAQLTGVPVVATPAGGTAEVVMHGETGFVLPDAEDPQITDVADVLTGLLANPARCKAMGEKAQATATPRFLIDKIIDRTARLFLQP
jgi:glycosyltransferase involved in cell wall biosynthesis